MWIHFVFLFDVLHLDVPLYEFAIQFVEPLLVEEYCFEGRQVKPHNYIVLGTKKVVIGGGVVGLEVHTDDHVTFVERDGFR